MPGWDFKGLEYLQLPSNPNVSLLGQWIDSQHLIKNKCVCLRLDSDGLTDNLASVWREFEKKLRTIAAMSFL